MAYQIIWSPTATKTFKAIVDYLHENWSEKEVAQFVSQTNRKLLLLSTHPKLSSPASGTTKIRKAVIHKRVVLFYKIRVRKREVELLY